MNRWGMARALRLRGALGLCAACGLLVGGCGGSHPSREGAADGGSIADAGGARDGGSKHDGGSHGALSGPDAAAASPLDASEPPAQPSIVADPDDEAAYIYDQDALRTYELKIAPDDLARIDADPAAEEYVAGMLRFEGRDYGPVGVRYKGSVGAFRDCLTGINMGAKKCTKLSMKVSFNWQDPEGRFYGLKKLQFHAMNRDPSLLKERLGYTLFRQFGIAAPRAVHARLLINGELVGLFALVEQIDGRFTRSRFREGGEGNLYKEGWPLDSNGKGTTDALLRPTLQTNEDESPSLRSMLDFGQALQNADSSDMLDVLTKYTDLDYTMRYVAVDRATGDDDGPFHWYCFGIACSNHNYYWYEEQNAERLWIVAWDQDSSFNLNNTTTTLWFDWDDTSLGCRTLTHNPYLIPLRAPTCDPLIRGWASLQQRYLETTETFLAGPFEQLRVASELAVWEEQIAPVVEEAAGVHADALTLEDWHRAVDALRDAIDTLRERARARVLRGAIEIGDPWLIQPMDAGITKPATTSDTMTSDFDGG